MSDAPKRLLGWLCYQIVIYWPGPWPSCAESRVFAWFVGWAGYYAHAPEMEEI